MKMFENIKLSFHCDT